MGKTQNAIRVLRAAIKKAFPAFKHVDASSPVEERIEAYNAENKERLEYFGLRIAAEAFVENGEIKTRPILAVAPPLEEKTETQKTA